MSPTSGSGTGLADDSAPAEELIVGPLPKPKAIVTGAETGGAVPKPNPIEVVAGAAEKPNEAAGDAEAAAGAPNPKLTAGGPAISLRTAAFELST